MSYRNDVAEAKRLTKRSEADNWRLAELTWTNVDAGVTRAQWAKDIGISASWASSLYRVWAEHGQGSLTFWEAVKKVQQGDEATGTRRAPTSDLQHASPAAIAKAVATNPDMARAIARNTEAREAVQVEAIEVRGMHQAAVDMLGGKTPEQLGREASHNMGKALGQTEDDATWHLKDAARSILEAMVWKDEYGIKDEDAEADAIQRVEKALRLYKSKAPITESDETFLSENGIEMVE